MKEALELYREKCDLIPDLLEYRRWNKALSTYIGSMSVRITAECFMLSTG